MSNGLKTASIIFAAGKGSRMKGYEGNKTLLPLIPGVSPFEGKRPMLLEIINNLPYGPKALVVNHRKEDVIRLTGPLDLTFCEQPVLNGTGGALIASRDFIIKSDYEYLLITMGDVPLTRPATFNSLLAALKNCHMAILGFRPRNKKKYGVLEIVEDKVKRIIEWEYWNEYPKEMQDSLDICNSGIYAFRKIELIKYLDVLQKRPHIVSKERNGKTVEVEEFFITDLVELMNRDGLKTGYSISGNEDEIIGVDDLSSLEKVQRIFSHQISNPEPFE